MARNDKRSGRPPSFLFMPPVTLTAGTASTIRLEAYDADDDQLAYDCAALPAGARLHPDTGVITWTPFHAQLGSHELPVTVTDTSASAST